MCQMPIGKVVRIEGDTVTVEYKGGLKALKSQLVPVKEGDYVMFSLGNVIDKIDPEEANFIGGNDEI